MQISIEWFRLFYVLIMNNLQNKVSLLQVQTLLILFMSFLGVNSVYAQKTKKVECGVCSGSGVSVCLGCSGTGVTMSSYMDMNGYFWPVQSVDIVPVQGESDVLGVMEEAIPEFPSQTKIEEIEMVDTQEEH